jgi:hypothetical protein
VNNPRANCVTFCQERNRGATLLPLLALGTRRAVGVRRVSD